MTTWAVGFVYVVVAPMPLDVCNVFAMRAPAKIADPVVQLVTIYVAALHSVWTRTYESLQHEAMDELALLFSFSAEINQKVSIAALPWPQYLSFPSSSLTVLAVFCSVETSDSSVVTDFVPLVANDGAPFFFHSTFLS